MLHNVYILAVVIGIVSVLLLQFMKNHPLFILSPILIHKYIIQKFFYPIKMNEIVHWKKSNSRSTSQHGINNNHPNIILIIADDLGYNDLSQPKRNSLYERDENIHYYNNINKDVTCRTNDDCSDSNTITRIGPGVETKHINSIRENGISFRQAYSGHATCAPSRAALFTGN